MLALRSKLICFLKSLLVNTLNTFGRDLEALFSRVEDILDLLQETLVLLELRVGLHCLLDEQFYVPQLAKVEVALALQARHSLLKLCVLLLESCTCCASRGSERGSSSRCGGVAGGRRSPGCGRRGTGCRSAATGCRFRAAACNRVVVVAGEVLVPVLLDELEELEVVLHLALDKGLDADGLVDLVLGECVCRGQYRVLVSSMGRRTLQYLKVLQVCIFCVGVELDARHGHIVEDAVEDLAERGAVPAVSVLCICLPRGCIPMPRCASAQR